MATKETMPTTFSDPIAESDLFTKEELLIFKKMLEEEKQSLIEKAKATVASGTITLDQNEMMDEVDLATATIEQNLTFRLLDRDRKLMAEIDHALNKLKNGDYGYCEGTGDPIPKRRLELRPWTRHSVKFKEQLEKVKKSGRGVVDEDEAN
jgi:DnaK suppressor protein